MKLNLVRVEKLRQFTQPVEASELSAGINLFCGPNESGKSTLVAGIRAAFFERHRSGSVDDLQPWGDSSASPHITLDFDWQGSRWHLEKSFVKQKRCDLHVDGKHFSGDDAEEKLAELLGFQYSARGASKPDHWGIPGLLWIEQGAGHELRQAVAHAGGHLKSALGELLGEVASSSGDQLIAQVQADRAALLTTTGRPTGDYAQLIQNFAMLGAGLKELDEKIDAYRTQVDRLGELRHLQQQDSVEKPWEEFRRQAGDALARLNDVRGWIEEQQREEKNLATCISNLGLVRDQLTIFSSQSAELEKRKKILEEATHSLQELQVRQTQIETRVQNAQSAHTEARKVSQRARQQEQRAAMESEVKQLERQIAAIDLNLEKARALQVELLAHRERLQANQIDPGKLKKLRKLTGELAALQIHEQAVATRLLFDLVPGQTLHLDGEYVSGQGERLLLQAAELEIGNFGTLRILPGGEDLPDLLRQQEAIRDDLRALLQTLGVESLIQAEDQTALCTELLAEIGRNEVSLESLAPQGIDALSAEQQLNRSRKGDLDARMADLPSLDGQIPAVTIADAHREAAEEILKEVEQAQTDYQRDLALAEQAKTNASMEWKGLADLLQAPDRQQKEQQANQRLMDLRAEEKGLNTSLAQRTNQIEAAHPDILEQDVDRFSKTADELQKAAEQRTIDLARLQSHLDTLGAQGLEEQRAETALNYERVGRQYQELKRRAEALDLLLELLNSKRHALTRRLQAPLQKHLNHYLQLLFPQASLNVDENLIPSELVRPATRGDTRDDYEALSFGAREQMGLISRLAYADLLQEAGRPTLIILDDALVHSDGQRLAQMKRILFDAAQRHQILLFSCHPENWRDLGVAAREMHALRIAL